MLSSSYWNIFTTRWLLICRKTWQFLWIKIKYIQNKLLKHHALWHIKNVWTFFIKKNNSECCWTTDFIFKKSWNFCSYLNMFTWSVWKGFKQLILITKEACLWQWCFSIWLQSSPLATSYLVIASLNLILSMSWNLHPFNSNFNFGEKLEIAEADRVEWCIRLSKCLKKNAAKYTRSPSGVSLPAVLPLERVSVYRYILRPSLIMYDVTSTTGLGDIHNGWILSVHTLYVENIYCHLWCHQK